MSSERKVISIDNIRSGDLLAWRRDTHSTTSDLFIHGIRALTHQKYGHVGIAWRCNDSVESELFVIEATLPKIRVTLLTPDGDFDCVPMDAEWKAESRAFLLDKLGKPYSILDAARAFYGMRLKDDQSFQCVELAHYFYRREGIELDHDFTPGSFVKSAEHFSGQSAKRVIRAIGNKNENT